MLLSEQEQRLETGRWTRPDQTGCEESFVSHVSLVFLFPIFICDHQRLSDSQHLADMAVSMIFLYQQMNTITGVRKKGENLILSVLDIQDLSAIAFHAPTASAGFSEVT